MADGVVAGAAVARAAVPSVAYIEQKLRAPLRRHDLASDNREKLVRTEQVINLCLEHAEFRIEKHAGDNTTRNTWMTWKTRLQHARDKCEEISVKVVGGKLRNVFGRVQRLRDTLCEIEREVKSFLAYAGDVEKERMKEIDSAERSSKNGHHHTSLNEVGNVRGVVSGSVSIHVNVER